MNKVLLAVTLILLVLVPVSYAWNANPTYNPFEILWNAINDLTSRLNTCETNYAELQLRVLALEGGNSSPEFCNGIDDNLDGNIDEDWPLLGNLCSISTGICQRNGVYVCTLDETSYECNATPGAPEAEICDGLDNDCDGVVDEDAIDGVTWFLDADSDGFGSDNVFVTACEQPNNFVSMGGDCDDINPNSNPAAPEVCDSLDNDCDGQVDEGNVCIPPDGTVCDDDNACTYNDVYDNGVCGGIGYSCNDGFSCTSDVCDGFGGCTHTPDAGFCLIDGTCYMSGILNPANSCQVCDPSSSATYWSSEAAGTACNGGSCNGAGVCI